LFSSSKKKKKKKIPPRFFFHEIPSLNDVILLRLTFTVIPTRKLFSRKFLFSYPPWLEVRNNFSRKTSQQQPTNTK
jgi:hypothetical protein